jgi:hypothetical protein
VRRAVYTNYSRIGRCARCRDIAGRPNGPKSESARTYYQSTVSIHPGLSMRTRRRLAGFHTSTLSCQIAPRSRSPVRFWSLSPTPGADCSPFPPLSPAGRAPSAVYTPTGKPHVRRPGGRAGRVGPWAVSGGPESRWAACRTDGLEGLNGQLGSGHGGRRRREELSIVPSYHLLLLCYLL